MFHRWWSPAVTAMAALALAGAHAADVAPRPTELQLPRFGVVHLYWPDGAPETVVLFVSGDGGWEPRVVVMAEALAHEGALVAGVDVPSYLEALAASTARCESLAVDLEALSHRMQKQLALKQYLTPELIGYSSGAAIAYAALAQSPTGTFAGAISLGFCPDQDMNGVKLCPAAALRYSADEHGVIVFQPARRLPDPWIAVQGQQDEVCDPKTVDAFAAAAGHSEVVKLSGVGHGFEVERSWKPQLLAAHRKLTAHAAPVALSFAGLRDLPLIEVNAKAQPSTSLPAPLAVLLTGDGGWAGIDREVSAALAAHGMPVVGFNTLRYFWNARTPEETARDVARTMEHYIHAWSRDRVVLLGYSLGADVLPFVLNRLAPELRRKVSATALIGLGDTALFEIHALQWLPGAAPHGLGVEPELRKLDASRVLCLYGAGESDSLCPTLTHTGARVEEIGVGHHLGGRYEEIAERILAFAAAADTRPPR
jgi:type IV secretory pathway VirJ component